MSETIQPGGIPVGLWARVSTDDQESMNQLRDLRDWARRRGFTVVKEYVLDDNSASKGEQAQMLAEAFTDARLGRMEIMLVWALDRVERRGVEATLGLMRRFATAGCPIWSLKEPFTETADTRMAELLVSIYSWMAAEESRRRSERVKAGVDRAKAEGKQIGGRKPGSRNKKPVGSQTRDRLRAAWTPERRAAASQRMKATQA